MKKLLVILMVSVIFVPFAYVNESKSAPIEMKLGHFAADSHPGNLASKMFAEGVEKRTNGNIKVIIYPNNALGSPPEVLEQNIADHFSAGRYQCFCYSQKDLILVFASFRGNHDYLYTPEYGG